MYKFTLKEEFISFEPLLKGVEIDKPYLKIHDCMIIIPAGYSWDGCTFAPDFKRTYYASCVHDAMYQYKIKRRKADKTFFNRLINDGFKAARLYYLGVRIFGKVFHKQ